MPRTARFARSRPAQISISTILIAGLFLACNALAEPQPNSSEAVVPQHSKCASPKCASPNSVHKPELGATQAKSPD